MRTRDAYHASMSSMGTRATYRPPARYALAVIVATALGLAGCSLPQATNTIDGFALGPPVVCSPPVDVDEATLDATCAGFPRRATAALDERDPDHAAIVSIASYTDGTQLGSRDVSAGVSPPPMATRHPGPEVTVFVFKLADGTTRATGVACSGNLVACVGVGSYPR